MLMQGKCDPEHCEKIINNFKEFFDSQSNEDTLKTYILGRKLSDDDTFKKSLFELVLSTAGQHSLIEMITEKLNLNRNDEYLIAVSNIL